MSICLHLYLYLLSQVEEGADQQLHQQHGERWACVRSAALTVESRRELAEVNIHTYTHICMYVSISIYLDLYLNIYLASIYLSISIYLRRRSRWSCGASSQR